jgi:hypothetical protein
MRRIMQEFQHQHVSTEAEMAEANINRLTFLTKRDTSSPYRKLVHEILQQQLIEIYR